MNIIHSLFSLYNESLSTLTAETDGKSNEMCGTKMLLLIRSDLCCKLISSARHMCFKNLFLEQA